MRIKGGGVAVTAAMFTLGAQRIPSLHELAAATLPTCACFGQDHRRFGRVLMSVNFLADTSSGGCGQTRAWPDKGSEFH